MLTSTLVKEHAYFVMYCDVVPICSSRMTQHYYYDSGILDSSEHSQNMQKPSFLKDQFAQPTNLLENICNWDHGRLNKK